MIIYKITNKATNQVYIGSSVCFKQRKNQHINDLNDKKHHNYKLQRDWNIYKEDGFVFEIIEKGFRDRQKLLLREYELINSIKECYYNIDRICPIIKEDKPKKIKSGSSFYSGKCGTVIIPKNVFRKLNKIKVGANKCSSKVKKHKMNPIKSTEHLDKMIEAKRLRDENKLKYQNRS